MVIGTAAFAGLGLLLAGTLRAEATLAAANLAWFLLLFFGGVLFPLSKFPAGLAEVLQYLPTAALADGFRERAAGRRRAAGAVAAHAGRPGRRRALRGGCHVQVGVRQGRPVGKSSVDRRALIMSLARRAARAALAASFISGGIDQIRNPQPKAAPASPIAKPIADRVPQLPNDPESLVKLDGAIKVVGGLGLIVGPFARPAALLLAGSLVPTTLAGHRFWETNDPEQRVSATGSSSSRTSACSAACSSPRWTPAAGRPSRGWRTRPRTARPRRSRKRPARSARASPPPPAH